ncbi:MAG: choice-of-anchor Q domain-containing protein [Ktedonobacteraceae bacterium]
MMKHPSWSFASWTRLVALSLLLSLSVLAGSFGLVAHAQAATTISVTTCDESHLDQALASANSGDTITFGCSGDIALTQTLTITKNLTLDGSGQTVTLDGQSQVQVLGVNSGVSFTLNALTIAHGSTYLGGGGLDNEGGTVSISNSTFANNSATHYIGGGGLLNDSGTVSISNSTFANNSASYGGGLLNYGSTVSISNSTFANNSASYYGGGLDNGGGTVSISNSTFANNSASYGGGLDNGGTVSISNSTFANNSGYAAYGGGGGLDNGGTVSISNSIVATNTGVNCKGGVSDQGYNLSSDSSCGLTGTGSLQNTDPRLDPKGLQNNGGPTQTIALLSGSPAIDTIPVARCPSTDQRGTTRPDNGETACDMGAYEFSDPVDNDLGLTNMPGNITTNATSPQGAVVTYAPPTATDEAGDSSTTTVNCIPASGSTFAIGTTTVNCSVTDSDDTLSTVTGRFTVTVQPVLSANGSNVTATEGSAFNGVVATGTAYGTSNPLSASITWGDGSPASTGTVTLNADGSYSVSGSHTYAEEGSYPLSVTVKDSGSLSATGNGTAKVADAALTLTHFLAGPLPHLAAGVAATFTDADPARQVSDYTATVKWGDGTTSTVKVYNNPIGPGFALAAGHRYASKGTYSVTLTVTDQGGSQVSKTVTITVK